jgi:general secretion pathway protein H
VIPSERVARNLASLQAGYLLLELLVVLAILALVLGFAVPNTRSSAAAQEPRTFATRFAFELRLARTTATLQGREVAFQINAKERWAQVDGSRRIELPATLGLTMIATQARDTNSSNARLVFFRDGSSTGGEISVAAGDVRHVVSVDWMTGAVRVEARASK